MIESVTVIGARGRVGGAVSARLRERGVRAARDRWRARPAVRPRPRDRRRRGSPRPGPVGRARERRDAAFGARSARAPVLRASAADLHARPRPGAARRGVGGRHGGDGRCPRARDRAGGDARPARRSSSTTSTGRCTTRARRSPRTTSSRSGRLPASSSRPPKPRARLSTRSSAASLENGFQLTGPIERGDWKTVERHRTAIAATAPELLDAYDALAALTARVTVSQESAA